MSSPLQKCAQKTALQRRYARAAQESVSQGPARAARAPRGAERRGEGRLLPPWTRTARANAKLTRSRNLA
jgi:hypothetical protein